MITIIKQKEIDSTYVWKFIDNSIILGMGEINMNKDFLTMIISLTVIIIFLTGCIEEETTVSTETPTAIESPTSLITPMETLTPTAIPTLEAAWKLNVTLKSGYKWYQNDELYYGFAYPENCVNTIRGSDCKRFHS